MRLVEPLLGSYSQNLNRGGGNWPLLQSQTPQPLPEFPTLVPPGWMCCRFRLGAASNSLCRSKFSYVRPLCSGGQIKRGSHWDWCWPSLQEGAKHFVLVPENSLWGTHTLNVSAPTSFPSPPTELSSAGHGIQDLEGQIQILSCLVGVQKPLRGVLALLPLPGIACEI